jgi:type IV secretion system protein VirB6
MAFQLFTPLFNKIDTATASFVTTFSGNTIAEITPVVTVALTLTFVLYALAIINGKIEMPIMDFLSRSVRVAIISSIALAGGLYQTQIADAIQKTPDEFASALLGSPSGPTAASIVDDAAGKGFDRAAEAFEKAGFFEDDGITYAFFGTLILLSTAVLTAIGGAFILLAKLLLAILAGIGPLFIVALLWQATARFFEMWAGQVLNYGLLIVLFAAVFGLMMGIFGQYMNDMKFDGTQNVAYALGGSVILAVAMVVLLLYLPSLASGLAGGVAANVAQEIRALKGMARDAGRAGAAGWRGAKAANSAMSAADIAASKATGAAARGLARGGRAAGQAAYRGATAAGAAAYRGGSAAYQATRRAATSVASGARRAANYARGALKRA